jgi:tether containing UBX domain for GLUT4
LGERNALLFDQAEAKNMDQDYIPDDFFELTVNDAKVLLRDMKKMRSMLEDSPLLTAAQRELEIDKAKLNTLHKYQQAVIRIQFPNQLVLQGLFGPLETVQAIKDFIKPYLEYPENDFVLCKLETIIYNNNLINNNNI